MKVYFPSYYNKFRCIAERCRHSCCVGWEIYLDSHTIEMYEGLAQSESEEIFSHIDRDAMQIMLDDGERCPFLECSGLCRLISNYGEGYISDICKEHPRFYHKIGEHLEGGIGVSCEEAARIILTNDDYDKFIDIEKDALDIPEETELDTLKWRREIYSILSDRNASYHARVDKICEMLAIPERIDTICEWGKLFSELELLDNSHRDIISVGGRINGEKYSSYLERFLAYLIFRHVSVADSYDNLRARVGFSILLAKMLENRVAQHSLNESEIIDTARIISEEVEYSEDNTAFIVFEFESLI